MKGPPRSLEEWIYYKLIQSPAFHKFVRSVYNKVNGIKPTNMEPVLGFDDMFHPTTLQKFKAYRILFWDEMRTSVGLSKKSIKT